MSLPVLSQKRRDPISAASRVARAPNLVQRTPTFESMRDSSVELTGFPQLGTLV